MSKISPSYLRVHISLQERSTIFLFYSFLPSLFVVASFISFCITFLIYCTKIILIAVVFFFFLFLQLPFPS
uniref:Uncharacterized protein n=1 Tax=Trypanosoma brucei TaxID=5691 RepID=Q581N4_9TRYP|nr:hypothetical protein, unlikely [Trypanosoma brucei]